MSGRSVTVPSERPPFDLDVRAVGAIPATVPSAADTASRPRGNVVDDMLGPLPESVLARIRDELAAKRRARALDNGFEDVQFEPEIPVTVQARLRYEHGPDDPLNDLTIGALLLVTHSCGANVDPLPETVAETERGGWWSRVF